MTGRTQAAGAGPPRPGSGPTPSPTGRAPHASERGAASVGRTVVLPDGPAPAVSDEPAGPRPEGTAEVALVGLPAVYRLGLAAGLTAAGLAPVVFGDLEPLREFATRGGARAVVAAAASTEHVLQLVSPGATATAVLVVAEGTRLAIGNALHAGATGVLPADAEMGDAVAAVRAALMGYTLLPARVAQELSRLGRGPGAVAALADHERTWLRLLADGTTVAALARQVGYSEREMYRLLAALYRRLGATTRTEALLAAQRQDLLSEPLA